MTDVIGAVYKVSCLAEEGMNTRRNNNSLNLTLLTG
jgi:hypothetical protein